MSAPGDVSGLAAQIEVQLGDPEGGLAMAARAFDEVRTRYGVQTMVQAYERLYQQVLVPS